MKYLLSFCNIANLFMLLSSCHQSIGDKLKSIVENNERGNENIEHLIIDSFRYSFGTLQDYYIASLDIENNSIKEKKYILSNAREIKDYPLIVSLSHEINLSTSKTRFLIDLINNVSPVPRVYNIDYFIDYQTDKSNYKGHRKAYLYEKDLTQIYINTDSLYASSSSATSPKYDSILDLHVLRMNDSLYVQKEKLKNELELRIAGGTNQEVILKYRLKMAEIDERISNNKEEYFYLYEY